MWGHILPMTIVVLSHIMSISPSAAAPQSLIIPAEIISSNLPTTRNEKSYDNEVSWEESTNEKSHPYDTSRTRSNLIDAAILLGSDSGGDYTSSTKDARTLTNSVTDTDRLDLKEPKRTSSTFELSLLLPKSENTDRIFRQQLWNIVRTDEDNSVNCDSNDEKCGRKSAPVSVSASSSYWIPNVKSTSREDYPPNSNQENGPIVMPTFTRRNEKRSPRCLRRCLAQGLLHPSQCHSLC